MHRFFAFLARISLLLLLAAGAAADTNDGWVLAAKARSPEDISLWTRSIAGAELKAFRGVTHSDAPIENLIALLYDTAATPEWLFRCQEAAIVGEETNGDFYLHLKIKGIWPLDDRDAIILVRPFFDRQTGEILMTGTAAPDYLPPLPNYVRIPAIASTWRLTPTPQGLVRIEWEGHVDPAGNVPRWLANSMATLVPRHTLRNFRNLMDEPARRSPTQQAAGAAIIEHIRSNNRPGKP